MRQQEPAAQWPHDVRTLAVDIGGSGVKASVLDATGAMTTDRVRIPTPYPCPPPKLVETVLHVTADLPEAHRVSVGFPGLVRDGIVRNVPSLSRREYGGEADPELQAKWLGFDLGQALGDAFDTPTIVVNDADMQGCAVVRGTGFEFVMTLGTGCGTAVFYNGRLLPHLELGHAPLRKGDTVEQRIGNVARKSVGNKTWSKRVKRAIAAYYDYLFFDHLYLGGGNAKHLNAKDLPDNAEIVPNSAGITGGVRVWELTGPQA
jgi:polyphosphate glucokinase